jgi:hypothetical protein
VKKRIVATLIAVIGLVVLSSSADAAHPVEARGCCSHHHGVCGCSAHQTMCCDGELSPTCTC